MDREIDRAAKQPGIEFLGPQRLAADLGERAILDAITAGDDGNQFDRVLGPAMRPAQPVTGFDGLGHGQRGTTGSETECPGRCGSHRGLC